MIWRDVSSLASSESFRSWRNFCSRSASCFQKYCCPVSAAPRLAPHGCQGWTLQQEQRGRVVKSSTVAPRDASVPHQLFHKRCDLIYLRSILAFYPQWIFNSCFFLLYNPACNFHNAQCCLSQDSSVLGSAVLVSSKVSSKVPAPWQTQVFSLHVLTALFAGGRSRGARSGCVRVSWSSAVASCLLLLSEDLGSGQRRCKSVACGFALTPACSRLSPAIPTSWQGAAGGTAAVGRTQGLALASRAVQTSLRCAARFLELPVGAEAARGHDSADQRHCG